MHEVIVIGGGMAGLFNAILLAKADISVLVIEKKAYPFHKVCGEYVSNEVKSLLQSEGLYPQHLSPPSISRLLISSPTGRSQQLNLPMGGFGVSRYWLEHFWYQKALEHDVDFRLNTRVAKVGYESGLHKVTTHDGQMIQAPVVIGAYGKRSHLDKQFNRPFLKNRSGYLAVKYHMNYPWEPDLIALHAFDNGYCGLSMVEEGKLNVCYLSSRSHLRKNKDIESLEKYVLGGNPQLATVLETGERLFKKPLVINEVSFDSKEEVVEHMLMTGDAAGMITPLCGNGMAMAIHSAKLLAPRVIRFFREKSYTREQMEWEYQQEWRRHFSRRLTAGRYLQRLIHNKWASELLVHLSRFPPAAQWIVRQTHGEAL